MRLNRCNECKADIEEGFPMISWFRYGPVREDQPKVMHFCSDLCEAKNVCARVNKRIEDFQAKPRRMKTTP